MPKTVPENKARQGKWGWHALWILIAALILVFIVWGAVEWYGNAIDTRPPTTNQVPNG